MGKILRRAHNSVPGKLGVHNIQEGMLSTSEVDVSEARLGITSTVECLLCSEDDP